MARYARKLTKQELIDGGITNITPEGRIFKHGIDITDDLALNPGGYRILYIYDRDENGKCIKQYYINKKGKLTYNYKQRVITLNRAVLAWFSGEIPDGYVADHINNKDRDDYNITNLQKLTPQQNILKERDYCYITETICNMRKPRSFYENKLEQFLQEYEQAKLERDAAKAHHLRSKISQTRARLRYWDSHKEEYDKYLATKEAEQASKDTWKLDVIQRKILAKWKVYFKYTKNKPMWHQICEVIKSWKYLTANKKEEIFKKLNTRWPQIAEELLKEDLNYM